ncbi:MAG: diphosphomevalonate decarboxylase [Anaerolineaceae bacterium]
MKSPDFQPVCAIAHPNIAFIKYWGNRDQELRIPCNSSLSMNLSGLETRTTVQFDPKLKQDTFVLSGENVIGPALDRVSHFLDHVRSLAKTNVYAHVESQNSFPAGAGIASSASAFAALAVAASHAIGLELNEKELSRIARRGSGSASRSIPTGFVEWQAGTGDEDSFAFSIAPAEHWNLVDLICVLDSTHKSVGSTSGHAIADTSPLQALRLAHVQDRVAICRKAILERDFEQFAEVVEEDSNLMHAVMRTSNPPLVYWLPETETILWNVIKWRKAGIPACSTVDAGPNVHVLVLNEYADEVELRLSEFPGVQKILKAFPGPGASLC